MIFGARDDESEADPLPKTLCCGGAESAASEMVDRLNGLVLVDGFSRYTEGLSWSMSDKRAFSGRSHQSVRNKGRFVRSKTTRASQLLC